MSIFLSDKRNDTMEDTKFPCLSFVTYLFLFKSNRQIQPSHKDIAIIPSPI